MSVVLITNNLIYKMNQSVKMNQDNTIKLVKSTDCCPDCESKLVKIFDTFMCSSCLDEVSSESNWTDLSTDLTVNSDYSSDEEPIDLLEMLDREYEESEKERKEEQKKKEERQKQIKEDQTECSICYDCFTESCNTSTTPCGHKFHSACLFKNFEHRHECPLCRTELIKSEEEEDAEDDDDDDDSTSSSDSIEPDHVSVVQMAQKLTLLGYTIEDVLMLYIGESKHKKDMENPRWINDLKENDDSTATTSTNTSNQPQAELLTLESVGLSYVGSHLLEYNEYEKTSYPEPEGILERLSNDIFNMINGDLAVNYTEPTKSYAQALMQRL
jgi:hypothetical protein